MKIYTKTGDDGTTGLQGNSRVTKSHPRIIAYGTIDEANAGLGIALSHKLDKDIAILLNLIQNELFVVGADLSNPNLKDQKNRVTTDMINNLEKNIDNYEKELPSLTNFILPGGNIVASQLQTQYSILWEEYKSNNSKEAKIVHQLDKLEMALQAKIYSKEGYSKEKLNSFFNSARNEINDPKLLELFTKILDK